MPKRKGAVIRRQWPAVTIVEKHGNMRYRVDARPQEGRRFFAEKAEALAHANELARLREQSGTLSLSLAPQLRQDALDAAAMLEPWGKSLVEAAHHYAAHLKRERAKRAAVSVSDAIGHYLAAKRVERERGELSPLTLSELRSKLRHVRSAFGAWKISEITPQSADKFLCSLPHKARGRANIRTKFSQFLNHCRRQGWIAANPLDFVRIRVAKDQEPHTLSAGECERLLRTAESQYPELVAYLAIGLFAGLRPGELNGLQWQHVHLETGQIEILGSTSKTGQKRYVSIETPLDEWLLHCRKSSGGVVPSLFNKRWNELRELAKLRTLTGEREWMNILRHTHASFWLEQHHDRPKLAERLGNSVDVIRTHYRRALPKAEVDMFWKLRPATVRKTVAFAS